MVGLIDAKQKESASVGYCDFDLTHDLDLRFFKVKFLTSFISGFVGLIDLKWRGWELIRYWAHCMILPFDHTYDLDLAVSIKVKVWYTLMSGVGRPIDMEQKGCEPSVHDHDIDFVWLWWIGWMYWLMTGVTSKVGMPLTYPVLFGHMMHLLIVAWWRHMATWN